MPEILNQVTPLLITYNEDANIERTLAGLHWARRIVVVDSGSSDNTLEILRSVPAVEIVHRPFRSFADQCNYGLSLIETAWCLSLDADHIISKAFLAEMKSLLTDVGDEITAVVTTFRYMVYGKILRGTLLPSRINLMRPNGGKYHDDGHAHRFTPHGHSLAMREPILHDDRKSLSRWLASQQRYLQQETIKLLNTENRQLCRSDRLRKQHVIAPFAVVIICLIWHRGIQDGWRGWFYAFQRLYVETLLSLMLWEARQNGQHLRPKTMADLPVRPLKA